MLASMNYFYRISCCRTFNGLFSCYQEGAFLKSNASTTVSIPLYVGNIIQYTDTWAGFTPSFWKASGHFVWLRLPVKFLLLGTRNRTARNIHKCIIQSTIRFVDEVARPSWGFSDRSGRHFGIFRFQALKMSLRIVMFVCRNDTVEVWYSPMLVLQNKFTNTAHDELFDKKEVARIIDHESFLQRLHTTFHLLINLKLPLIRFPYIGLPWFISDLGLNLTHPNTRGAFALQARKGLVRFISSYRVLSRPTLERHSNY